MGTSRKKAPALAESGLAELQAWFGRAISRPLPDEYPGNPLEVSHPGLKGEADALMRAKGGLSGFGRVGIYNQQYWFRLVSIMQADYTCAIHLMGLKAFNDWTVRYLEAHPPASPFLAELDAGFPAFLEAGYRGSARAAVLQAVAYERALSKAFDAPADRTLAESGITAPEALLSARLRLAAHATPMHVDWDFAEYRGRCLADDSLEQAMDPPREEAADLVIYRDADLEVMKRPVAAAAMAVLREFRAPATLGEVFARLEGKLGPAGQAGLEAGLSGWFRDWVAGGWLCLEAG
jgi:hypothetical protein